MSEPIDFTKDDASGVDTGIVRRESWPESGAAPAPASASALKSLAHPPPPPATEALLTAYGSFT